MKFMAYEQVRLVRQYHHVSSLSIRCKQTDRDRSRRDESFRCGFNRGGGITPDSMFEQPVRGYYCCRLRRPWAWVILSKFTHVWNPC